MQCSDGCAQGSSGKVFSTPSASQVFVNDEAGNSLTVSDEAGVSQTAYGRQYAQRQQETRARRRVLKRRMRETLKEDRNRNTEKEEEQSEDECMERDEEQSKDECMKKEEKLSKDEDMRKTSIPDATKIDAFLRNSIRRFRRFLLFSFFVAILRFVSEM